MTEPAPATQPEPEVSKYAETMLFLTPDIGGNFAIRCYQESRKNWYPIREFIANVHKDIISPSQAEELYTSIFLNVPEERGLFTTIQHQFLGPYEKPLSCMKMPGLSIVYHQMELRELVLPSKHLEFAKVMKDCIEGNSKLHLRLHDDGQLKMHELELEQAIAKADPEVLKGNPPENSMALFNALDYLAEAEEDRAEVKLLKEAVEKRAQQCKAEAKKAQEKADQTIAKLRKQLQAKDIELDVSKQKTEALANELKAWQEEEEQARQEAEEQARHEAEEQAQQEEEERKRKGEAFTLRNVVDTLKLDLNSAEFNKLSQTICSTMKAKYPDRPMFQKKKITHFYPAERRLVEVLVSIENHKKNILPTGRTERGRRLHAAFEQKTAMLKAKPMTRQFSLSEVVRDLDCLHIFKATLDPEDHVEIRERVFGAMERGYPHKPMFRRGQELFFNGSERVLLEMVATQEACAMIQKELDRTEKKPDGVEPMQEDAVAAGP